jgi:hypothetical protein
MNEVLCPGLRILLLKILAKPAGLLVAVRQDAKIAAAFC